MRSPRITDRADRIKPAIGQAQSMSPDLTK